MGERKRGRGPKGRRVRAKVPGARAKMYTILPAFSLDGYIACSVFDGTMNQITYNHWIKENLLPKCSPFPGSRSVIVMDNTKAHKCPV